MKITMAASQKTASQFIVIPPFPGFTGMIGLYGYYIRKTPGGQLRKSGIFGGFEQDKAGVFRPVWRKGEEFRGIWGSSAWDCRIKNS
jgi:hypothetical protein